MKDHNLVPGQIVKNHKLSFVAQSMMNKFAKFHEDSPSGEKLNFNLARAIELSEMADFVYNFVCL